MEKAVRFTDQELELLRALLLSAKPEDLERHVKVNNIVPLFKTKQLSQSAMDKLNRKLN